ncbi:hypothetical protein AXG93_2615s1050 [Marchantia polymorpha subsp. ruderalis]|uniref:Uncharacterized protein n=1 Tax=Marchantia polymorpha subsp. ruderalis TaxID=1480154 RepID=A0A176WCE5_MARPO|nr:hypothetical protein AXG93_2615s1050 [Marchantia polymorpha subsp. ruderalis]
MLLRLWSVDEQKNDAATSSSKDATGLVASETMSNNKGGKGRHETRGEERRGGGRRAAAAAGPERERVGREREGGDRESKRERERAAAAGAQQRQQERGGGGHDGRAPSLPGLGWPRFGRFGTERTGHEFPDIDRPQQIRRVLGAAQMAARLPNNERGSEAEVPSATPSGHASGPALGSDFDFDGPSPFVCPRGRRRTPP